MASPRDNKVLSWPGVVLFAADSRWSDQKQKRRGMGASPLWLCAIGCVTQQ